MLEVSEALDEAIKDSAQKVVPKVIARFADNRYLDNLTWSSSSEFYEKQILRNSCKLYWRFDDLLELSDYTGDYSGNGITGTLAGAGFSDWVPASLRYQSYYDVVVDEFTRADNLGSLGVTSDTNAFAWEVYGQVTFGIISNEAYCSSYNSPGGKALIDMGNSDGWIEVELAGVMGNDIGLYIRYVDEDNWVAWNMAPGFGTSFLQTKIAGGAPTNLDVKLHGYSAGDTVRLQADIDTFTLFHNNVVVHQIVVEDDEIRTGTRFGLKAPQATTARYNDVSITAYDRTDRSFLTAPATAGWAINTDNQITKRLDAPDDSTLIFWLYDPYGVPQSQATAVNLRENLLAQVWGGNVKCHWLGADSITYTVESGPTGFKVGWSMIVMRKSGNKISVFVDGEKMNEADMLVDTATGLGEVVACAYDSGGTFPLFGAIDEISFHDIALTDKQIESLYFCAKSDGSFEGAGTYFTADQAINGVKEECLAYAVCDELDEFGNKISFSGEYKVLGATQVSNGSYGWWSRSKTNGSGIFTKIELAWYEFDSRKANSVELSTGYTTGRLKDFILWWYESDGTLHEVEGQFDKTNSLETVDFGGTYDVICFGIQMISTWNPYDIGRIYEANLVYDVDISDDVVSLSVEKVRDNYDSTLPIGLTSANTGSIALQNIDKAYNPYGDSDYAPYIQPDTEFFISLGWELEDGTTEYVKLADSLFADSWNVESAGMTASPALRDFSKYIQETTPAAGMVFENVTAGRAITEMLKAQGYPARKIVYYDSYYRQIVHDRPWAFWRLSDTTTTAVDEGGRFNGTLSGTYTQGAASLIPQEADPMVYTVDRNMSESTDPNKRSVFSTDFTAGMASLATDTRLEFPNDWTAEATVRVDAVPVSPNPAVILLKTNLSLENNYTIYLSHISGNDYRFVASYSDNTGAFFQATSKSYTSLELIGKTFHLVGMRSGNKLYIYVNGELNDLTSTVVTNTLPCQIFTGVAALGNWALGGLPWVGAISSISLWNHALTEEQIKGHWLASQLGSIYVFSYLFFKDATPWDAMLEFATADVGMFYFDENAVFHYEYSNTFHESVFERHQETQYDFSDEDNIIDGSHMVDVQANRVIVLVNPLVTVNQEYQSIWKADEGESLAVTQSTQAIDPSQSSLTVVDTENPLWLKAGYIKMDDEIMSYSNIEFNKLLGIKRGLYGTKAAPHANGSLVREARVYNISYTDAPAVSIKRPFVTAKEFESKVNVDKFVTTPFGAEVVLSAEKNTAEDELVMLQGKNPVNELNYAYAISGIPVQTKKTKEQVEKEVRELTTKIRRFRPKEIIIDNQFIQDKAWALKLAEFIIRFFAAPVQIVNLDVAGVPQLQLGDLIKVTKFDKMDMTNETFWVIESKVNYDGGVQQSLTLREFGEGVDG